MNNKTPTILYTGTNDVNGIVLKYLLDLQDKGEIKVAYPHLEYEPFVIEEDFGDMSNIKCIEIDSLSMITCVGYVDHKHNKPWYLKGRW